MISKIESISEKPKVIEIDGMLDVKGWLDKVSASQTVLLKLSNIMQAVKTVTVCIPAFVSVLDTRVAGPIRATLLCF